MSSPPQATGSREIGRKTFGMPDQQAFAAASLDVNPMHMDAVAARRLLTGRPVVHGIHVLLTALELWAAASEEAAPLRPTALNCTFNNPVSVDEPVVFTLAGSAERAVVEARVDGLLCARLRIQTSGADAPQSAVTPLDTARRIDDIAEPIDEAPEQHVGRRYRATPSVDGAAAAFPLASRAIGAQHVAALLKTSFFVGMVCPGRHSIYSSLDVTLPREAAMPAGAELDFTVRGYDPRFRLFDIALHGALNGRIAAFQRPPEQAQPRTADLTASIAPGEFRGTRSLVIGASRGLGEITAKMLAAGGGDVLISYADGKREIDAVAADIDGFGAGRSRVCRIDVRSGDYSQVPLRELGFVFYFATPRINRKKREVFVPALFDEFIGFYAAGLFELCRQIEASAPATPVVVFVPSSVFVDERPDGLLEYAMAKAATEVMAAEIDRTFKHVVVKTARLPKLSTDQTASVLKSGGDDNLRTLLPIIRATLR